MQLLRRLTFTNVHRVPSIQFVGPRHLVDPSEHHYMMYAPEQLEGKPVINQHHHHVDPSRANNHAHEALLPRGPPSNAKFLNVAPLEEWQIDAINEGGAIDMAYLKVRPIAIKK